MKDVELHPYMLAIYRDNEHHHLLKHALECWQYRTKSFKPTTTAPRLPHHLGVNPIHYCPNPPLELFKQFKRGVASEVMITSKIIQSPEIARWAFEDLMEKWKEFPDFMIIRLEGEYSPTHRVISLIEFDDDLIYRVIMAGIGPSMPEAFHQQLNDEQRMAMTICA